jgi:hypothetical protein
LAQQDVTNEFRRQSLSLQERMAEMRRDMAANKPDTAAFKVADNLRNEYNRRVDKIREGVGHAENATTLLSDPSIGQDAIKQISLIFAFGKMIDPASVVRETEQKMLADARGLYESLKQYIPALQTGAKLAPSQLKSMQSVAQSLLQGSQTRMKDLDDYYINLAKRRQVDPQDVLPSYSGVGSSTGGNDLAAAAAAELAKRQGKKP